jgi:hypothetical protein
MMWIDRKYVFEAMIETPPPFHHPNTFLAASVDTGIILTLLYLDQCVSNWVARNLSVPHRDDRSSERLIGRRVLLAVLNFLCTN